MIRYYKKPSSCAAGISIQVLATFGMPVLVDIIGRHICHLHALIMLIFLVHIGLNSMQLEHIQQADQIIVGLVSPSAALVLY